MKLDLADTTRIGRAEGNDLVLSDALVSREHARITRRNLSWLIEDLGSRHGTFLNRRRVEGTRPLLTNDEVQIGQSRFLFDGDVDVQNADFSDQSVYLAAPTDETLEVPPVAVLPPVEPSDAREQVAGLEFVVQLGELFDSTRVAFPDALHAACLRLAALFRAEALVLFLRDTVANDLRPSVALFPGGETLTDSSIVRRVAQDRKSLLVSDRPELAPHPAPGAPQPPATRSVLCAPVELDESLLGVLYLQRGELDAYSLLDLRHVRAVARLLAIFIEARQRAAALEMRAQYATAESNLVGASPAFRAVRDMIAKVAPTPASVLLTGETGTGKEMIAREIHRLSPAGARGAEFVAVNCSAIPETLFESHLFGHEKGAFTGAVRTQQGLIERANGGTLFLDEIGELAPAMQPKLLRFLQERVFTRVGGTRCLRADVRLICATNRNLADEIHAGRFREDLFHRISVMPIELPPLRQRTEDIPALAAHLLERHARAIGRRLPVIGPEALDALLAYPWPGNIRELSNCLERAVLLCDDTVITPSHLIFQPGVERRPPAPAPPADNRSLTEVEREHIARVLAACGGNQLRAADILGIHRNTLRKKLREYDLDTTESS